jgi:tetratricopeptide (TPR) repeat protein
MASRPVRQRRPSTPFVNWSAFRLNQAKSAVSLAPQNPDAWANLGSIYRALVGVAGGAEDWALAAYQQAVALSPNDPLLRLDLGGVYFVRKDYQNAINQFGAATQLKSDLPNAWYNLAQAYKANGDEDKALEALRQTLAVLPADLKNDRAAVQKEIAQLEGNLPEEGGGEESKTEQLKEPTQASPSAKNVPPPVEVESPPATKSASPDEPIRITP